VSFSRFDIFFSGKIIADKDPEAVREEIGRIFKVQGSKLDNLFSGTPVKVKKNVDVRIASQYRETFRNAGALIDIKPSVSEEVGADEEPEEDRVITSVPEDLFPAPVQDKASNTIELMPANSGDLEDCAPEVAPAEIPDISTLNISTSERLVEESPAPAPPMIDISQLSAEPANTGTLEDCAEEIEFTQLPDISTMDLSDEGETLDDSSFVEPPDIDTSSLSVAPANTGSLEDCAEEKEAIKIPDISKIKLADDEP